MLNLIADLSLDPLSLTTLEQAFLLLQERLRGFASDPEFSQKLALAFGSSFDGQAAQELALAWQNGDFSAIPAIAVLSASQLNGANGAFAAATNTIYLSEEFLSQNATNIEAIARVLIEEIGHGVDQLLNEEDSAGDEGAIFSALVMGESLSDEALAQLKAENDSGTIVVDGQQLLVENNINNATPTLDWIRQLGGGDYSEEQANDLTVDNFGNVYIVGYTGVSCLERQILDL